MYLGEWAFVLVRLRCFGDGLEDSEGVLGVLKVSVLSYSVLFGANTGRLEGEKGLSYILS